MKTCCDFCSMLVLTFFALLLSMGSLQAQTQANCDLSKCSPEERAACAKRCIANSLGTATSLTDFLFEAKETKRTNCNPAACAKAKGATAKLVSTETKPAPVYSNSLETAVEELTSTKKKKCDVTKCRKAKASL